MAFEYLSDADVADEFSRLTASLAEEPGNSFEPLSDVAAGLILDISSHLHRLAKARENRSFSWFDYHRTWPDSRLLDVVLVDQYDPESGEKYTRIITRADDKHDDGMQIAVTDEAVAPLSQRFIRRTGSYLILKTAKTWPLGDTGRPILRPRGDEVDLLAGRRYDHYSAPAPVPENDMETLIHLQNLATLLSGLGSSTEEPYIAPGIGTF